MSMTGWTGEAPDAERPAMPVTSMLLSGGLGERQPGDALTMAAARGRAVEARELREEREAALDPDEYASALVVRGYLPGQISQLSMRLAETEAQLADEETKIEKAARRAERTRQMHERGQISAFGIAERMSSDIDEGDPATVDRLRRRADRLRGQLVDASAAITPPQERQLDGVEAASRHAHRTFVEVTRQRMAEAQGARPEPRPFASRGGYAVRAEPVTCEACLKVGATPEQSFWIHHADADGRPVSGGEEAELPEPARDQEAGRGETWPVRYSTSGHEITRAVGCNDEGVYGNHAPVAYR